MSKKALRWQRVPKIGYDKAAALAKRAYDTGKTIREVALAEKVLSEDELNTLLNG
jgi:fumarate hydratase class II